MADPVSDGVNKTAGIAKSVGSTVLNAAWTVAPYVLIVAGVGVALNPALAAGAIAPITGGAQGIASGLTTGVQTVSAYAGGTGAAAATGVQVGTPGALAAGNSAATGVGLSTPTSTLPAAGSVGGVQEFAFGMGA